MSDEIIRTISFMIISFFIAYNIGYFRGYDKGFKANEPSKHP